MTGVQKILVAVALCAVPSMGCGFPVCGPGCRESTVSELKSYKRREVCGEVGETVKSMTFFTCPYSTKEVSVSGGCKDPRTVGPDPAATCTEAGATCDFEFVQENIIPTCKCDDTPAPTPEPTAAPSDLSGPKRQCLEAVCKVVRAEPALECDRSNFFCMRVPAWACGLSAFCRIHRY